MKTMEALPCCEHSTSLAAQQIGCSDLCAVVQNGNLAVGASSSSAFAAGASSAANGHQSGVLR